MKFNKKFTTLIKRIASTLPILVLALWVSIPSCTAEREEKILTLTESNFSDITGKGIVLVDFWATWCMPCRKMAPVLDEIAVQTAGKVIVGKVDIDANGSLANQFGIQSIPTLIIFKDGQPMERLVGIKSKASVIEVLSKYTSQE